MRRLATAVSCLALAALAACSGPEASAPPEPEESVGATSDSATESSAPDDASTTSAPVDARGEDPGVPELPAEAMEDTEEGAEAFVQYYIDLLNYTGLFPGSGILDTHADERCGSCDNYESEVNKLAAADQHYDRDTVEASDIQALRLEGGYRVNVVGSSPQYYLIDSTGSQIGRARALDRFELAFKVFVKPDGAYRIEWIKDVLG